ncbi:MAG: hypothetical protein IJU91_03910 [Selenomonadaceae bacterium]|nr:hypothetical protein [Selenomonadaceae bacterium]
MAKKNTGAKKITRTPLEKGINNLLGGNRIFNELYNRTSMRLKEVDNSTLGKNCAAIVQSDGRIFLNKNYQLNASEWEYVIAHCILHLAFGHFDAEKMPTPCDKKIWNTACDIYIAKFLYDVKIGTPPFDSIELYSGKKGDERQIYDYLVEQGQNLKCGHFGTAAIHQEDMQGLNKPLTYNVAKGEKNYFTEEFAMALAHSVSETVGEAGGHYREVSTPTQKAAEWFINHYPLLGGLAAGFKIIEDVNYCWKNEIQVAAVDVTRGEIYVNPAAKLNFEELKFVLAHEFLHAGLQHHERCQGRDAYLWNVACDFVVNSWLYEMQVGKMPQNILYDEDLKNMSAEEIYDRIIRDIKKFSKLQTLRGWGKGDIISDAPKTFGNKPQTSLDEFYKNALRNGLEYHLEKNRGLIPAGLIEEIKALAMPPIGWDVELGKWFDIYFKPLQKTRTYARPSRRQGSTPDIPRPRHIPVPISDYSRTFGVVIDTSGSMTAKMIGYALGAIASYSAAKDVPCARVIFCDAQAYDAGYLSPDDIAGRVEVKGRGGTILQPAVDLLVNANDFPKDAPILIITDGWIERDLAVRRDHAFLIPRGHSLPFITRSKIFHFSE